MHQVALAEPKVEPLHDQLIHLEKKPKKWLARVERPITYHFGKSFSILLHFEWFKMSQERLLKLYKSSLNCKAKGAAEKEQ